ncbi:MAG: glycosyltransferase family 2 protein [Clostridia bacterium]
MNKLYLVIPCYNEEKVLPETVKRLNIKLNSMSASGLISSESKILFVDDGSKDKTWNIIQNLTKEHSFIEALKLSHNAGHQNALLAGLMTVKDNCDCCISMDVDLQDDIEVLDEFVTKFNAGAQIVYGVRNKRENDSFFKKSTAKGFYKLMKLFGTEIINDHADYRLMSSTALNALAQFNEVNLFLRGLTPLLGFKCDYVYYDRHERFAGESKYPVKKMISFAVDGITSFSVKPLKIISNLGIFISFASVLGLLYALISYFTGHAVSGWTAIVASIWLLGGIQMLCLGTVGTYIGKIYSEVKSRPRYIVEKHIIK